MRRESSAVDHIIALATSAKDMWSMDTGAWEIRAQSQARSRQPSSREVTLHVRIDDWSTKLRRVAFAVSVAMIAVAIGLALRGKPPTVIGVAEAAPAASPVVPSSTMTVTPIDEITVTPIEQAPETTSAREQPLHHPAIKKAKSSHKKVRARKTSSHRAKKKR